MVSEGSLRLTSGSEGLSWRWLVTECGCGAAVSSTRPGNAAKTAGSIASARALDTGPAPLVTQCYLPVYCSSPTGSRSARLPFGRSVRAHTGRAPTTGPLAPLDTRVTSPCGPAVSEREPVAILPAVSAILPWSRKRTLRARTAVTVVHGHANAERSIVARNSRNA